MIAPEPADLIPVFAGAGNLPRDLRGESADAGLEVASSFETAEVTLSGRPGLPPAVRRGREDLRGS